MRAFDAVGAFRSGAVELSGESGEPERIPIARVSADLFPMLGVQPLMGRLFSAAEDAPGSDLALISWSLWQRRYAANPGIIGQAILLDRRPYTVIGVMPQALQFPSRGPGFNNEPGQIWIPIAFAAYELQRGGGFENSGLARLRSGATLAQARAELDALAPRVQAQYPPALRSRARAKLMLFADPLRDQIVGDMGKPLVMLLGAIGLVLLVACANVAEPAAQPGRGAAARDRPADGAGREPPSTSPAPVLRAAAARGCGRNAGCGAGPSCAWRRAVSRCRARARPARGVD